MPASVRTLTPRLPAVRLLLSGFFWRRAQDRQSVLATPRQGNLLWYRRCSSVFAVESTQRQGKYGVTRATLLQTQRVGARNRRLRTRSRLGFYAYTRSP
jgi:hypothetical protein